MIGKLTPKYAWIMILRKAFSADKFKQSDRLVEFNKDIYIADSRCGATSYRAENSDIFYASLIRSIL